MTCGPAREGGAVSKLGYFVPQATMPKSSSRRAPRAMVKTTSRGPFREVEGWQIVGFDRIWMI
ncbi:hypothetical protein H5410_040613 [Solanum commersonii]|uniref:Uncharacterized protein n=1 Tax=Solanum commersonii TaxID=4109 RepID=A0A9J5XPB4_SOLCO|nr:hypothetical protein H5410_040613 [Solanum commersonii]